MSWTSASSHTSLSQQFKSLYRMIYGVLWVRENNEQYGLSIKLMTNDDSAVPGVIKLILAKGVNNFFIMAGPDGAEDHHGRAGRQDGRSGHLRAEICAGYAGCSSGL